MTWLTFVVLMAALALCPAGLYLLNLLLYRAPVGRGEGELPAVSVLIPARNEEANIEAAVRSALATSGVELEVVVLNDHSSDRTCQIVRTLAAEDDRVRLEHAPDLPAGWSGKQHACFVLAGHARHVRLLFIDADVRLSEDALPRLLATQQRSRADLLSGIPHQQMSSPAENLLVPMIHFILLSYLPIAGMRRTLWPSMSAGCGQLFLTTREAYDAVGGHRAIRETWHDGIMLPRAYRSRGFRTDLVDLTPVATCRMYRNRSEVVSGVMKNATEAIASPRAIGFWTQLLGLGQVLPAGVVLLHLLGVVAVGHLPVVAAAAAAPIAVRVVQAMAFGQSGVWALAHPLGVAMFLALQWTALLRQTFGWQTSWRGRVYGSGDTL